MSLNVNPVVKCLDRKLTLGGFELPDLLAILITVSLLNFLFGSSNHKLLLIWCPVFIVSMLLYFGKRGKAENHFIHWLRFQVRPKILSAFPYPTTCKKIPRSVTNENEIKLGNKLL